MTATDQNNIEEFIEAKNNWELEKLYVDLASAKGKALTPVEKKFLRGLLCGFSPAEIATTVYQSRSSNTVRVYLSNGLYKYIEEMLSIKEGITVKVKNWSRVTQLLEKAGYKKNWQKIHPVSNKITINAKQQTDLFDMESAQKQDWGEAIDVDVFQGRKTELAQLEEWIVQDRSRLVMILGMSGIGKTVLSVKLAEQIQDNFEYIIWRSLHLAPSPEVIFSDILNFLSKNQEIKSVETLENKISQLIDYLRHSRILLVLDNLDSILCNSNDGNSKHILPKIHYRQGFEAYGELIKRLASCQHQSCLLLTSREKPQQIAVLEGEIPSVHCLKLSGLTDADNNQILKQQGFNKLKEEDCKLLFDSYGGNPLFIKLAASAVTGLFAGNVYEFLEQGSAVFGDIRQILDQQFHRLSDLEKQIMYWLGLNKDLISVRKMQKDILPRVSQRFIWEAIELLQRRSLIDRQASNFYQNPVLREYIVERLIEENFKLIEDKGGSLLMSHTIFEAQLKNYIREIRTGC